MTLSDKVLQMVSEPCLYKIFECQMIINLSIYTLITKFDIFILLGDSNPENVRYLGMPLDEMQMLL